MNFFITSKIDSIFENDTNNPIKWMDLCVKLSELFGAVGTAILPLEKKMRAHCMVSSPSLAKAHAEYLEKGWYLSDYRERGVANLLEKGWTTDFDFVSQNEMKVLPYYNDFLAKNGLGGFVAIRFLVNGETWFASIQFPKDKLAPSPQEIEMIGKISQALEASSSSVLSGIQSKWTVIHQASDMLNRAIMTLDINGIVHDCNELGSKFISTEVNVDAPYKSGITNLIDLVPIDVKAFDNVVLQPDFHSKFNTIDEQRFVWCSPNGASYAMSIGIVPPGLRLFNTSKHFIVTAKITQPLNDTIGSLLTNEFGLTSKEVSIAFCVVQGKTVKQTAVENEISEGNARQHLKRIFRKMDVDTQHQLVASVLNRITGE